MATIHECMRRDVADHRGYCQSSPGEGVGGRDVPAACCSCIVNKIERTDRGGG
jgi:hypothetical protein